MLKCPDGCDAPIHGVCLINPHKGIPFGMTPRTYEDGTVRMWCAECGRFIEGDSK